MKKFLCIICVITIILTTSVGVFANSMICGEVLNTDIKAYIDSKPIKSYNIAGWTAVMAEDLINYGFNVEWDAYKRTLSIDKSNLPNGATSSYQFEENTKPIGSHAFYVYKTDIKTFVAGNQVNAFNIGGWTIIYIDQLEVFGDVVWDSEKREISYAYKPNWNINLTPQNASSAVHNQNSSYQNAIKGISGRFVKNQSESFDITGENLDHISWINLGYNKVGGGLQLGFSMVAHHLLADEEFTKLCTDMSTISYDGFRLQQNADLANKHTKIYINGNLVKIKDVKQGKGNNHLDFHFVLDFDISKEDIKEIYFECNI